MSLAEREPTTKAPEAYDALVARLERVVTELETGKLSLEQSIEKFAEGIDLAREAGRKLDDAERRVETLTRNPDGSQGTAALDAPAPPLDER